MTFTRKSGLILAGVTIAALALSACSGGGGTSTSPSDDAAAVPNTGWTVADRDDVAQGGTLSLAIDQTPINWNISEVDSGTVDDNFLSYLYLPSYIKYAADGSWTADPNFATSVELVSDDPQVVEVKINPDAVWSDGTPMTVADLQGSWKANNGENPDYLILADNVWKDIESIEPGTDDKDVLITFANKNADWPAILGAVWPTWLTDTPEHYNTAWINGPLAADGTTFLSGNSFILSKFDATGQVLTFTPNPKWWGDAPKLDSIIFKAVDRSGLAQAFANNELDAINLYGNADNYATAKARSDAEIQRSLSTTYRHITLNGTADVFKDEKVRQAFAKSLNREVIAASRLAGVESPVTLLGNLIYLPGQDGYEDDATDVIGYDVDGAKKILEDDGFEFDDDGYASKDGTALEVRFVIPSDNPNSAEVAQQVQAQTAEAGFKVNIDVVPSDDFFDKYVTTETRDFDATYFAWQGTAFPVSSTESIYYPADSGQNYPGVTDESLGDDFLAANAELDVDTRIKLAQAIDKKLVNLVTTIPLFPETYVYGVKSGLVNYGPTQFETIDWPNVGFTK